MRTGERDRMHACLVNYDTIYQVTGSLGEIGVR